MVGRLATEDLKNCCMDLCLGDNKLLDVVLLLHDQGPFYLSDGILQVAIMNCGQKLWLRPRVRTQKR